VLFWSIFLVLLVVDQVVKAWARHAFPAEHQALTVIPNVFDITLTFNKGVAFGLFQGAGVLLTPIAIAIAFGAFIYSYRHPKESSWVHIAMALLASGALGNLYDRIAYHQVTDMFWFRAINFPVFNVADSCITIAATILIVKWGREAVVHPEQQPQGLSAQESPASAGETPSA
jgi:signal peptidase II